jgi:hypothetical protein
MLRTGNLAERIIARILGTHFSYIDLLAYAAGISGCLFFEQIVKRRTSVARRPDVLRG